MKLNRKRKGFTLVEIMIVVAIIALLATIAVPNFLRVRKRSQATRVLEELRMVEGAKDQWALEKNKVATDTPTGDELKPYFKAGSALEKASSAAGINDSLGNAIVIGDVDTPPQPAAASVTEFGDVVDADFWGAYAPPAAGGGGGGGGGGGE